MFIDAEKRYWLTKQGIVAEREIRISKRGICPPLSYEEETAAWKNKAMAADGTVVDLVHFKGEAIFRLGEINEGQISRLWYRENTVYVVINEVKKLVAVCVR
ncbi:MAG: hypothetical protein NTV88_00955 [Candidatus Micrarchaeota archaeon]|nr:hypothetical protein [Candidatus Micrarchaeota archaeon]